MPKPSIRLQSIVKLIYPYRIIADIGCDHGYLALEGFNNDLIDFALLVDNKIGPLNSAKENLSYIDINKYQLSLSNGISELTKDIECVLILGMGGINICDILTNKEKLKNIKRLILQPNNNTYLVRKFLMDNCYNIVEELIIYDKKYYEVIVAEPSQLKSNYTELELKYGPINIKNKTPIFKDYLLNKINRLKKVKDIDKVTKQIEEMEELLWK